MKKSPEDRVRKFRKELYSGALSLVLLAVLEEAGRPMYGYETAKELERRTGAAFAIQQGTLYPILRSLEHQGLLASRMRASAAGPPRRYYRLTKKGREALESWSAVWRTTRDAVDETLGRRAHDRRGRKIS